MPSFFGDGNITFFEHISLMIRASAARDARGDDAYLANIDAFKLPINFITGSRNKMFVPKGLQRTYDTLRRANGAGHYTHHVIPDYAHLDLWLGANAERDVWPMALAELESTTDDGTGDDDRPRGPAGPLLVPRGGRACRTAARAASPRASPSRRARCRTRARTSRRR